MSQWAMTLANTFANVMDWKNRSKVESPSKDPGKSGGDVKSGGLFNNSDETAFYDLMGRMNKAGKGELVIIISRAINSLPEKWQQRKFRSSIGNASRGGAREVPIEVEVDDGKGGKKKKTEMRKVDFGEDSAIEFLTLFASYTDAERLEVFQASGVMDSEVQSVAKWFEKALSLEDGTKKSMDEFSRNFQHDMTFLGLPRIWRAIRKPKA